MITLVVGLFRVCLVLLAVRLLARFVAAVIHGYRGEPSGGPLPRG